MSFEPEKKTPCIPPLRSTQQVRPLLAQRTKGRLFSTARNTALAACCHCAALSPNQPLLVRFKRKSVSDCTYSRVRCGNTSSKQINTEVTTFKEASGNATTWL